MRILHRYIATSVITAILQVLMVLLALEIFMELIGQLNDLGKHHYGFINAFQVVLLKVPSDLYQLFPMAGFIGSLVGLGRLANTSELLVMRASTLSVAKITLAVLRAASLLLIVVTLLGEGLAPLMLQQAQTIRLTALDKQDRWSSMGSLWFRHGHSFYQVGRVVSAHEIKDVLRYDFDQQRKLKAVSYAARGREVNGQWLLSDIQRSHVSSDRVTSSHLAHEALGFPFKPTLLQQKQLEVGNVSLWHLWRNIRYRRAVGLLAAQFEFNFWQRLLQPITSLVLIALGIPFIFGSLREASMGLRLLVGILMGFAFYMLNQLFGPISMLYQFPPWLAAMLPTALFMFIYMLLLHRVMR